MHSVHLCSVIIPTFVATLSMMSYTSLCWLSLDTSFVTVWLELYRDKFVSTILFKRLLLAYRHSLHSLLNDCCSKYNSQGSMKSSWCVYRQILLKLVKLVIWCAEFSYFNFPPRTHCNLTKNFLSNACSCPEVFFNQLKHTSQDT